MSWSILMKNQTLDPSFIMKRRRDLESYLQSVFKFLQHSLPQNLAEFLCLTKYDQHFVLRQLASQQYELMTSETLKEDSTLTPLELFAISRRLKTPVIWVAKFPNEENLFFRGKISMLKKKRF